MSATPLGSLAESIRQHPTTKRALPLLREPPAPHGLAACFLLTSLLTFTLVTPLKWRSQSGDLTSPCLPYSVLCVMPPARGAAITGASRVTRVGAPLCLQLSPRVLVGAGRSDLRVPRVLSDHSQLAEHCIASLDSFLFLSDTVCWSSFAPRARGISVLTNPTVTPVQGWCKR